MKFVLILAAVMLVCLIAVDANPVGEKRRTEGGEPAEDKPNGGKGQGKGKGKGKGKVNDADGNVENGADVNDSEKSGKRGGGRDLLGLFRSSNFSADDFDVYNWTRQVSDDTTVQEKAVIKKGKNSVVVRTNDPELTKENITRTITVYDFTNATRVALIVLPGAYKPCLLIPTSLTFNDIQEGLKTRNNTQIAKAPTADLAVNPTPLTSAEVEALKTSNPSVKRFCGSRHIVRADPPAVDAAQPADGSVRSISVDTFDFQYTIQYTASMRQSKPKKEGPKQPKGSKGKGKQNGTASDDAASDDLVAEEPVTDDLGADDDA